MPQNSAAAIDGGLLIERRTNPQCRPHDSVPVDAFGTQTGTIDVHRGGGGPFPDTEGADTAGPAGLGGGEEEEKNQNNAAKDHREPVGEVAIVVMLKGAFHNKNILFIGA